MFRVTKIIQLCVQCIYIISERGKAKKLLHKERVMCFKSVGVLGAEQQTPSVLLYLTYHPCQHQHLEMSNNVSGGKKLLKRIPLKSS